MGAFREVLRDLWEFVCCELTRYKLCNWVKKEHTIINIQPPVDAVSSEFLVRNFVPTKNKAGNMIDWVAYVQSDNIPCFKQPEIIFDTKIGYFSYGDKLTVSRTHNNFAEVILDGEKGWVDVKDITDNYNEVMPVLEMGFLYDTYNNETIKLRKLIKDESLGGQLGLPLQSLEFILALYKQKQIQIPWSSNRPRLSGNWKTFLRGTKGVSLTLQPRTGSVLEYAGDEGVLGFLGYVEAVHPDLSIVLQTVGRLKEGEYRVEKFTHDEWKEWRPVFTSFT